MGAVLVLRALALALHDDAAWAVGDAHRAVGLVDVLAAGARGAIGVDAQILVVDLDLDLVVDDRIDPDRGEAGVAAVVRIERRDAHQAMHAALGLEPAIGVGAGDPDRRRFDPGLLAAALFEPFDLVAVRLGPARIHAQQHLGPILRLGAAGAGMDLEIAVVGVGLARQQAFELAPGGLGAQLFERSPRPRRRSRLRPRPRPIRSARARPRPRARCADSPKSRGRAGCARAAAFAPRAGSSHRRGFSASAFSSARRRVAVSQSKMPPQQRQRPSDVAGRRLDLGAHAPAPLVGLQLIRLI